jgi:hypothetical protein
MALPYQLPFGFSRTTNGVIHGRRLLPLRGNDWACLEIVRGKLDARDAIIESDNEAHTSLMGSCGSATIKVPGKQSADKNGATPFAVKERGGGSL